MHTFKHRPLNITQPTFRLVRLLAGTRADVDIRCEIIDACFDSIEALIPYEALSYTWGNGHLVEEIKLDGKSFRTTPNLYIALQYLRFENEDRILWIDSLCIDQGMDEGDDEEQMKRKKKEKAQQIQQMGTIYRWASRVIFWLGPATYETNVFMDSMHLLQKESSKYPRIVWKDSDHICADVWTDIQPKLRELHSSLDMMQRTGLEIILKRQWFKRVWILQEVANATQAIVVCGSKSVSAGIFSRAPSLMGFEPETHCQSVIDVMPGRSRDKSWWNQKRDLFTLLVKFGKSEATDPRDHIRALLGISSDAADGSLLHADTVQEVIKDTTAFLLRLPEFREVVFPFKHCTMVEFLDNIRLLSSMAFEQAQTASNLPLMEKLLLHHNVDVNFQAKGGEPVLLRAVRKKQEGVVALLLTVEDINVNVKDQNGQTPLHIATCENAIGIVRHLLARHDIDANLMNSDGIVPFVNAVRVKNERIIGLFLRHFSIVFPLSTSNGSDEMIESLRSVILNTLESTGTAAEVVEGFTACARKFAGELQNNHIILWSLADDDPRFMYLMDMILDCTMEQKIQVYRNPKTSDDEWDEQSHISRSPESFSDSVYISVALRISPNGG